MSAPTSPAPTPNGVQVKTVSKNESSGKAGKTVRKTPLLTDARKKAILAAVQEPDFLSSLTKKLRYDIKAALLLRSSFSKRDYAILYGANASIIYMDKHTCSPMKAIVVERTTSGSPNDIRTVII